ncbi:MAG TPA: hypothetical protein VEO54_15205 [Thermoanaerobaculia bacterium]|nr:hypothetical protein [Thermoanaerobaculia bacterium]
MGEILKQFLAVVAIAIGRPDLALRLEKDRAYARALVNERSRLLDAPVSRAAAYAAACRRLDGPQPLTFGTLQSGEVVRVRRAVALMSALVLGATGAGKSRFLLSLLLAPLRQVIDDLRINARAHRDVRVEVELVDPKAETYTLASRYIAALWLRATPAGRDLLARSVRVIDWQKAHIAPIAPYDNHFTDISNAYLAHLRTDVTVRSSAHTYTDSMKQLAYMLAWLAIELRFPFSYRFAVRFLHDAAFRADILARVPEPEVRYYFSQFDLTVPKQTRDAVLRRMQWATSFPEVRASICVPPAALDRLGLLREAPITLVNTACTTTLPQAIGTERTAWRAVDVLCAAPRRDASRPKTFVLEEAVKFFEDPTADHVEALQTGLRTLRSVNMGIVLSAQDFTNSLPATVVRTILLNTTWIAGFRANEDARIFWPHVVRDSSDRRPEDEQRRAFERTMHDLARQHFVLLVKGEPALPLRAPDVPHPSEFAGICDDELRDVFTREIAVRSMLPTATAMQLIEEWEAGVVEQAAVPPVPTQSNKKPAITSLAELKRFFAADEEDE